MAASNGINTEEELWTPFSENCANGRISFYQRLKADENVISDNGWRPILNGAVYQNHDLSTQNNRKVMETPQIPVNNDVLGEFIEVVDPPDISKRFMVNLNSLTTPKVEVNQIDTSPIYDKIIDDEEYYGNEYEHSTNKPEIKFRQREERKLNFDLADNFNTSMYTKNQNNFDKIWTKVFTKIDPQSSRIDLKNTYEVTEALDDKYVPAKDQDTYFTNGVTASKKLKINKNLEKNNLTSNLLKILANYDIRTSDKLVNYPLSLRQNSRNSDTRDFVYVQLPIKLPLRYNNANHLSVDPLLAVFLSNYGHYIPGFFGFSRNYKNLYGYLASNNIHNNQPFGPYKLFSDTDSSF